MCKVRVLKEGRAERNEHEARNIDHRSRAL
jgi:hypothetical protein